MTLIAIDIGTTHCKAGLFDDRGRAVQIASRPTISRQAEGGWRYYDPAEIIETVAAIIQEVTNGQTEPVSAVGIASMAETGLLVDRRTGAPRSKFIPWFDTAAQSYADQIQKSSDPLELYQKYGLHASFKSSLAKILWLCREVGCDITGAVWLSAADYVAYWLTGVFGTDYSLAGRTLAFRVDTKVWDDEWLRHWGLSAALFPPAAPSGLPLGTVAEERSGLRRGTPVAVCGHDHVCAALAMGAVEPGVVFDSMGTAETLIGALPERPLTEADFRNGLQYGLHVAPGLGYWMGGLSASGGSVEWFRSLLPPPLPSYTAMETLLNEAGPQPTGIIYFPYLFGSGSPHTDPYVRGAFIGLSHAHGLSDLFKAIMEGTAYELEFIRRAGEQMTGQKIPALVAAGGGTRYQDWMQIKADVSGCQIEVSGEPEATLLGAALAAGIGAGLWSGPRDALEAIGPRDAETYSPNPEKHALYQNLYERGYLVMQDALRRYSSSKREVATE